jgi:hypothetical protein
LHPSSYELKPSTVYSESLSGDFSFKPSKGADDPVAR